MHLQEEHFKTFMNLVGVVSPTKIKGYSHFPPSKFQRLQQELGIFHAAILYLRGNLAFCVVGKNLKYFRGDLRIDHNVSIRWLVQSLRARMSIIPLAKTEVVSPPLASISLDISLSEHSNTHAKVGYNTAIVFFALYEGKPVVLHCPTSQDGQRVVKRHRLGIRKASQALMGSPFELMVPGPIGLENDSLVSVQTVVNGSAMSVESLKLSSYKACLDQSLDWILHLHTISHDTDKLPYFPPLDELADKLPDTDWKLVNQIEKVVSEWANIKRPGNVLSHGDYWLGNVLFDADNKKLTGVIDWEWCNTEGLPGLDALQMVLMSKSRRSKRAFPDILVEWFDSISTESIDEYGLTAIFAKCGYRESDVRYLTMYLWLDTLRRGYLETQAEGELRLKEFLEGPVLSFKGLLKSTGTSNEY